jgi:hypothetical protein
MTLENYSELKGIDETTFDGGGLDWVRFDWTEMGDALHPSKSLFQ